MVHAASSPLAQAAARGGGVHLQQLPWVVVDQAAEPRSDKKAFVGARMAPLWPTGSRTGRLVGAGAGSAHQEAREEEE